MGNHRLIVLRLERDWLVVDKPPGLAVHSAPGGNDVLGQLARDFPGEAIAAVHRLDAATSGCLLVARTKPAFRILSRAFSSRMVEKSYLAVVHGQPAPPVGEVFTHIAPEIPGGVRMVVVEPGAGPTAMTHYRTVLGAGDRTLLEAMPVTGRTHQLRVHFRHLGHPLVGDLLYGYAGSGVSGRLMLHAHRLGFPDPENPAQWIEVVAPVPGEFRLAMPEWSGQVPWR